MSSYKIAFISALSMAAYTNALACGFSDFQTMLQSTFQGLQIDPENIETDCFASVGNLNLAFDAIKASFDNFSFDNYLDPLLSLQNSLVETTTVFSNCGTTTLIN